MSTETSQTGQTPGVPAKPFDVVEFVLRRTLTILLLGGLFLVPLGILAWRLSSTYYEANGVIQLSRVIAPILGTTGDYSIHQYYQSYVNTQVYYLQKDDVLSAAIEQLPEAQQDAFVLNHVKRALTVEPVYGTHLIKVTLKARQPEGVAELVDNIMRVYLENLRTEEEENNERRLEFLHTERDKIETGDLSAQAQLDAITQQLQTADFEEGYNPYRERVKLLREAYVKAKVERSQKEGLLAEALPARSSTGRLPQEVEKAQEQGRRELEAARKAEAELLRDIEQLEQLAAQRSAGLLHGQEIEKRLDRIKQNAERLDQRIFDISVEAKLPLRVSVVSWAKQPDRPTGSNMAKLLLVAIVVAFGTVGGLFALYDILDNRIRSSRDLKHALGVQPLRPIPHCRVTGARDGPAFARITLDYPNSMVAVAVRGLSLRLNRERLKHGAKSAFFTCVDGENGATEILLNTAHAMTRFCGKVLVVEANTKRPALAALTGALSDAASIEDVLNGTRPLEQCVVRDAERGLDVLPFKGGSQGIAHLALDRLLETARARYDFVLVDTAPILDSDVTEYVAQSTDIAVFIVEGDYSFYRDVRRALDFLFWLEVPVVVSVLNWGGHPRRPWFLRKEGIFPSRF